MFFNKRKRHTDSAVVPATAEQSQVVPQDVEQTPTAEPNISGEPESVISDQDIMSLVDSSNQESDNFITYLVETGNVEGLIQWVTSQKKTKNEREKALQGLFHALQAPASGPSNGEGHERNQPTILPAAAMREMVIRGPQHGVYLTGTVEDVVFMCADLSHADFTGAELSSLALVGCDAVGLKLNVDDIKSILPGAVPFSDGSGAYSMCIINPENSPYLQKKFAIPADLVAHLKNRYK